MGARLSHDQIEDLLDYIGVDNVKQWKGDKIQFCCPIHGESHPSCGINADYSPSDNQGEHYQVFHCFSCGQSGTLSWFLFKSMPDKFKSCRKAEEFLKDRYGVTFTYFYDDESREILRYEDKYNSPKEKRFELPMSYIAPYKSGKETYQYFFNRGFDEEDMKKFMIGRDLKEQTITIPAFWEDGKLAGLIGRFVIDRPKNMRFRIYDFPKSSLIYPLDKVRTVKDTLIGVESMLDAIMMHKWGFPNTVAVMGNGMSKEQSTQISDRCSKFIALFDKDKGGRVATEQSKKVLSGKVMILLPTYYPEKGKDPCDWGEIETNKVLKSVSLISGRLPRV